MRRRPSAPRQVFIHADALHGRHANEPRDALVSLDAWRDAIEEDELIERAEALVHGLPVAEAEEEVRFATAMPGDVVAEGCVPVDGEVVRREGSLAPSPAIDLAPRLRR